jgi:type IV secretion system protein VirD4
MNKNNPIPPLIIFFCDGEYACGVGTDSSWWFTSEVMQRSDAFVIYDPDRSSLDTFSLAFSDNDYVLKILNLSDVGRGMRYNPFKYVTDDCDVYKLTTALINGTKGLGKIGDIDFLTCETMLINALLNYIHHEAPDYEQNIQMLITALEHMMIEDYQDGFISAVDVLFEDLGAKDPWHTSVLLYGEFMETAGDSGYAMEIAKSCIARLAPFKTPQMEWLMSGDELRLDNITAHKTALFVVDGGADGDIKFLVPLMYSQLYDAHFKQRA